MRQREKILANLEEMYREAYGRAEEEGDAGEMEALDLRFQRDQLFLEALLDIRALLSTKPALPDEEEGQKEESLLEKAERLRRITRLR